MDDGAAPGLELQLLGPVRLCRDGRPQALKTRKAMALLMLLVLGGPMARPRLCAWLWPRLDEQSARRNLRCELARLREVGAADALRADGDMLYAGTALGCDLRRAEALLAQGDPDAAAALWRG
jgi:DNA-binding SARP family transcriptional activator